MVFKTDLNISRMTYSSAFTVLTLLLYLVNKTCAVTGKGKGVYFGKALKIDSPDFDKLHIYTTIPDISFAACVEQCKLRYVCGFVNYRFQAKMCYILRTQDPYVTGYEDQIINMPGFALGVKSEWQQPEIRDTTVVKQESRCRPRYHITKTRKLGNLDNSGEMVLYSCNATLDMDMPVIRGQAWFTLPYQIRPAYLEMASVFTQSYKDICSDVNSVKKGLSSCYAMFWESQSGLNAYDGSERQMNKVLRVDNGGKRGEWYVAEYCPVGMYAVGYTLGIEAWGEYDNTALNVVKLHCASINDTRMRIVSNITSGTQWWTTNTYEFMCSSVDLLVLTSFTMKVVQETNTSDDETAANSILFRCRDFNGTQAERRATTEDVGHSGRWSKNWSESCPPKSAICGLKTRIEEHQGNDRDDDDTALNDVHVYCCRV